MTDYQKQKMRVYQKKYRETKKLKNTRYKYLQIFLQIFLMQLAWSILLFNKTHQIVYFH